MHSSRKDTLRVCCHTPYSGTAEGGGDRSFERGQVTGTRVFLVFRDLRTVSDLLRRQMPTEAHIILTVRRRVRQAPDRVHNKNSSRQVSGQK